MRILQVIPSFSPSHAGGVTGVVYQLSRVLARRGHTVTIYTTDFELDEEFIDSLEGVKVYPFRSIKLGRIGFGFYFTPGMIQRFRKEIKNFDIIHMHHYITFQNVVACHYAQKYNIPYLLQAHGGVARQLGRKWVNKFHDTLFGYRILKGASRLIVLTPVEAGQYKSMGLSEDKIEVVPNGIDLSEFEKLPPRGEFRRKYGLIPSQKIILFLGRIHKIKGLDLLAKAFADLSKPLNSIRLVIVGPDDGHLSSLKKLIADLKISDKVLFTGPLYGQEKLKAYVDADVYVLPSVYETFPVTVLEAWACGTPVVVTDRCGIADVINGQGGLVVPYDKEQLQQALLHMLDDDKMRLRFAEKGRLLVREKFNWERIVEQEEEIHRKILQL
jgi:glycosyltransferase involved in cell wall biosynthesis